MEKVFEIHPEEHTPSNCISGDDIRRAMGIPVPKRETGFILVKTSHGVMEMPRSEFRYLEPDQVRILLEEHEQLKGEHEPDKRNERSMDLIHGFDLDDMICDAHVHSFYTTVTDWELEEFELEDTFRGDGMIGDTAKIIDYELLKEKKASKKEGGKVGLYRVWYKK